MKKFTVILLIFCSSLWCSGCKKENAYLAYISDLKQDVYTGQINDITVTAYYGFCEEPFINDGIAGEKVYGYTFKLDIIPDDVRRLLELSADGNTFSAVFTPDEVTSEYKAFIEIKKHFEREFTVTYICGSEKTPVTLCSLLPENCISYERALELLTEKQQPLLSAYNSDNGFNAEIYMRIFIKNDAPYWYVGIANGNGTLKALLIDGVSGELLAVREIF